MNNKNTLNTSVDIAKNRVQKVGGSLMVTLPYVWVQRHKVEKGDVISIQSDQKGRLIIKPCRGNSCERQDLDFSPPIRPEPAASIRAIQIIKVILHILSALFQ